MRSAFAIIFLLALTGVATGQPDDRISHVVDSVYSGMSVDQRIGQLFMIRAHSNLGAEHVNSVKQQVRKYHVGSMCFFQGTPEGHATLINQYQEISLVPIMMAIDAEWGGGMRFKEHAMSFPRQLTLGAIEDNTAIYDMGLEIGRQLRQIGIHVNFAPVVDINVNPANPVINDRSFGEDRYDVTAKSFQYMKGLQDAGVMACAKHFPGHGDTDVDSHLDLPVINHSRSRLDSVEMYPFEILINKGLQSIMIAHLQVPALDQRPNMPTSLSPYVIDTILRQQMLFDGLIFTDALEMKGVTKHRGTGKLAVEAFLAGNDVIVLPEDIDAEFQAMQNAVEAGIISQQRLEISVKRILRSKAELGLFGSENANTGADLFPPEAIALKQRLYEHSVTVVANTDNILPIGDVDNRQITSLVIGSTSKTNFQERLDSYAGVRHINVAQDQLPVRFKALIELLSGQDIVIVGLQGLNKLASQNFGVHPATAEFVRQLNERTTVILVLFGSPYALKDFENTDNLVLAFEDDPLMMDVAAQALFGVFPVSGRLPVSVSAKLPVHHGISLPALNRLGFALPESVGMSSDSLGRIGDIVDEMIRARAAPGCQILVARRGKVIFNRSYGYHTYNKVRPVVNSDLYDLASVTKVASTTIAAMQMYEQEKLFPRQTLSYYLDEARGTNKAHLVISDVMSHQAGLQPWLPFHENTVRRTGSSYEPDPEYFRSSPEGEFTIPVAEHLYLINSQADTIWKLIIDSPVKNRGRYRYSDIGFYIIAKIVERQSGLRLDMYCDQHFYRPLGIDRTCFLPLSKFRVEEITPTEEDRSFRKQRLQGYVHDSNSAMMGGVGGHAGLFSNAEGLAVVMQMLMNGGTYGGKRYLDAETIDQFATRVPGSTRRGLGFDMKDLNSANEIHCAQSASRDTYGHTGFTGTCVWNDPEQELVFIFLSNRTYPSSRYNTLSSLNIRERVHQAVYNSIRQ